MSGPTIRDAVKALRSRGIALCRPDPVEKKPTYKGWSTHSLEAEAFSAGDQVGAMGGPLSDGGKPGHALVIVDLDSTEANQLADGSLPATAMMEGRKSKPRSHRYYLVPCESIPTWGISSADQGAKAAKDKTGHAGPFLKHFQHRETKKGVLDFLGTGGQAVCPPSKHPSGELREWEGGEPGDPAVVSFFELWEAVCDLASACGCEIPNVEPKPPRGRGEHIPTPVVDRARKYLAKMLPSISGAGGHKALFKAARAMVWGFDLDTEMAYELLCDEFNPRCQPTWSERELRHKIEDADRRPFTQPRGHIRDAERPERNASGSGHTNGKPPSGNGSSEGSTSGELVITSLASLRPKPVHYLVPGRVPAGMLGLLAGEGGHGKSMTTLELAAALSVGRCAFGLSYPDPVRGKTILISCEDDWERTIVPRLVSLGADLTQIGRVDGVKMKADGKTLDFHLGHFEHLKNRLSTDRKIRLWSIDPAGAYIGRAGVNENKDAELRGVLGPLSEIANQTGSTGLLVKHLNKTANASAVQRVSGSSGYVNAVRFAYLIAPNPKDDEDKLMLPIKANVLPAGTKGMGYKMVPIPEAEARAMLVARWPEMEQDNTGDLAALSKQLFRQDWRDGVTEDPNQVTGNSHKRQTTEDRIEKCVAFIRQFLGTYAWPEEELADACERAGFSSSVVWKTKARLRGVDKSDPNYFGSKPYGPGKPWWHWIGPQGNRPPDRPQIKNTEETEHTGNSESTEKTGTARGAESAQSPQSRQCGVEGEI